MQLCLKGFQVQPLGDLGRHVSARGGWALLGQLALSLGPTAPGQCEVLPCVDHSPGAPGGQGQGPGATAAAGGRGAQEAEKAAERVGPAQVGGVSLCSGRSHCQHCVSWLQRVSAWQARLGEGGHWHIHSVPGDRGPRLGSGPWRPRERALALTESPPARVYC